jgi:cyclohexyl-isocyanide hydratase
MHLRPIEAFLVHRLFWDKSHMIPPDKHLEIGSLAFDALDQMDLTGPFEVFAGLPNSTHRIFAKTTAPVRDVHGLKLVPDALLADAPQLDVVHIPGGFGQEALMEDEDVLGWIRRQAKGAQCVFAVCTGVLICGAASLIKGRQATTHWSVHHLLPFFGGAWWWTVIWSLQPGSPRESTARFALQQSCAVNASDR